MQDEDILKAERRVMEMNRLTKQFAEQGSRYIQNNNNNNNNMHRRSAPSRTETETRFEPAPFQNGRQAAATNTNPEIKRSTGTGQNNAFPKNNMQNRSNGNMQNRQNRRGTSPQKAVPPPPPPVPEPIPEPPASSQTRPPAENSDGISEIFPSLGLDSEQLLLIVLMYLLIREKADIKLIAALGYILL